MSHDLLVQVVYPTLELATKWRIIVTSASRLLLSRENPLIDVIAGAGHVKGVGCVPLGRSGSESVIQDLSGSWCIKGTGESTLAGAHHSLLYITNVRRNLEDLESSCQLNPPTNNPRTGAGQKTPEICSKWR